MKVKDILVERFNNFRGDEKLLLVAFHDSLYANGHNSMKGFNMSKVRTKGSYKLKSKSNKKVLKDLTNLVKSGYLEYNEDDDSYKISKMGIKAVDKMMIDDEGDIHSYKYNDDKLMIDPEYE